MPTERMPSPAALVPGAAEALAALDAAIAGAGVDGRLLALAHLRAGQLNGCAPGVAAGVDRARRAGASDAQLHALVAWRQTSRFSAGERAALALTEAVTRLGDGVPDRVWDVAATHFDHRELAGLLLAIALANAVNRLDVPTHAL